MFRRSDRNDVPDTIDYDFHGFVGIRLLDALPTDTRLLERQFGYWRSPLQCKPDIVIRFVDQLALSSPLRQIGLNETGFTDDQFIVLKQVGHRQFKMQISFDESDETYTFVCERGLSTIPLVVPVLNLAMVSKGILPLHASAFVYNGTGILTMGWAKGGKTELLMAFAAHNATYIGDEWVYLDGEGRKMHGFPLPITLRDWHFSDLPQFWKMVEPGARRRMQIIGMLSRSISFLSGILSHGSFIGSIVEQSSSLLQHFKYAAVSPERLFGKDLGSMAASLDKVFFVVVHESPEIVVQPTDPEQIASRMFYSLQYERMHLLAHYLKLGFAFPDANHDLLLRTSAFEKNALFKALSGKESYTVYHPYPVSLPSLFDAVRPYIDHKS
jgi:hypothetical protein